MDDVHESDGEFVIIAWLCVDEDLSFVEDVFDFFRSFRNAEHRSKEMVKCERFREFVRARVWSRGPMLFFSRDVPCAWRDESCKVLFSHCLFPLERFSSFLVVKVEFSDTDFGWVRRIRYFASVFFELDNACNVKALVVR